MRRVLQPLRALVERCARGRRSLAHIGAPPGLAPGSCGGAAQSLLASSSSTASRPCSVRLWGCSAVPPRFLRVSVGALRGGLEFYVGRAPSETRSHPGRKAVGPFAAEISETQKKTKTTSRKAKKKNKLMNCLSQLIKRLSRIINCLSRIIICLSQIINCLSRIINCYFNFPTGGMPGFGGYIRSY